MHPFDDVDLRRLSGLEWGSSRTCAEQIDQDYDVSSASRERQAVHNGQMPITKGLNADKSGEAPTGQLRKDGLPCAVLQPLWAQARIPDVTVLSDLLRTLSRSSTPAHARGKNLAAAGGQGAPAQSARSARAEISRFWKSAKRESARTRDLAPLTLRVAA